MIFNEFVEGPILHLWHLLGHFFGVGFGSVVGASMGQRENVKDTAGTSSR